MAESKSESLKEVVKTKKKKLTKQSVLSLHEAFAYFKIGYRSYASYERKFNGQKESIQTWSKLLGK